MFKRLTLAVFAACSSVTAALAPSFPQWVHTHGKSYPTTTELAYREEIYNANVARIEAHNAGNATWTMGVNKFADLTADEFKARYTGGYAGRPRTYLKGKQSRIQKPRLGALPSSVDWVAQGAVTPVKNQGDCGSCWSFSTTGAVEGAWFLSNGTLVSLSEQQLIDCSTKQGNQGCNGGLMDYAFQYIVDNKGITTESAYPYTATGPNKCKAAGKPIAATLTTYSDVTANSETALMTAVAQQPVSVAVEADQNSFQFYTGGVMTATCGTNLDHGVLAVGYGTASQGGDYWYVKNSWGADWGMNGYILLGRGTFNGNQGQCGIQMQPSYPTV